MEPRQFLGHAGGNGDPSLSDGDTDLLSVVQHNFASMMAVCEEISGRVQNVESRLGVLSRDVSCMSETLVRVQMKLGAGKGYVAVVDSSPSEKAASTGQAWLNHSQYHLPYILEEYRD